MGHNAEASVYPLATLELFQRHLASSSAAQPPTLQGGQRVACDFGLYEDTQGRPWGTLHGHPLALWAPAEGVLALGQSGRLTKSETACACGLRTPTRPPLS